MLSFFSIPKYKVCNELNQSGKLKKNQYFYNVDFCHPLVILLDDNCSKVERGSKVTQRLHSWWKSVHLCINPFLEQQFG